VVLLRTSRITRLKCEEAPSRMYYIRALPVEYLPVVLAGQVI
jgi:hypothetical protein